MSTVIFATHLSKSFFRPLVILVKGLIRALASFLAFFEIWPVSLAIAASIADEKLLPLAFKVILCFGLLRWLFQGRFSIRTPVDGAIGLLLLTLPLTFLTTSHPEITRPQVYRLLTGIALCYTIVNWATSPARLRFLATGMTLTGLAFALGATKSVIWMGNKFPFLPPSLYSHFSQSAPDTVNPNVMAGYLVIIFPLPLALLLLGWRKNGWFLGPFALLAPPPMLLILVLTQSRGALTALLTVFIVLGILLLRHWRVSWLNIVFLGINLLLLAQRPEVGQLWNTLTNNQQFAGDITRRVEIWAHALLILQHFPFALTGVGMGTFEPVATQLAPFVTIVPSEAPHAHNLFLQIAVDLGIPGLVAWLAVLLLVIVAAWRVSQIGLAQNDGWLRGLGCGLLCSQVALIVHGFTDAVTWGMVRPAPLVWALWGLALASWQVAKTAPCSSKPKPNFPAA